MSMNKFNKSEGKLDVLTGRQANVLNDHFQKTGKTDLGSFSDEEREQFESDLAQAREADESERADQDRASGEGMPEEK